MSHTRIYEFHAKHKGKATAGKEFYNAWGFAPRIWDAVWDLHHTQPDPADEFGLRWADVHRNDAKAKAFWELSQPNKGKLDLACKRVFALTFDLRILRQIEFVEMSHALDWFDEKFPVPETQANHLRAISAELIRLKAIPGCLAIGIYGHSCGENLFLVPDEDASDEGECRPYNIRKDNRHAWLFDEVKGK